MKQLEYSLSFSMKYSLLSFNSVSIPSLKTRLSNPVHNIIIYFAQEVINILIQPGLLMEWDPLVKDVSKVTIATTQDVVSISFNCTSIIAKTVCYLRECFGGEINAVYARQVLI